MASGSNNLTSYKAKQIIGSSIAASPSGALLLTGEHYTGNTWLYHYGYGGTTNPWGIFHDTTAEKLIIKGSGTDSFWIKMDTGDTYVLGKMGIGYDPNTTGNNYKLYVNGSAYFNIGTDSTSDLDFVINGSNAYLSFSGQGIKSFTSADANNTLFLNYNGGQTQIGGSAYLVGSVGIGYDPDTNGNTYKLYVNGSTNITSTTTFGDYLYRAYTASDQTPMIWMNSSDFDNYLWQIGSGTTNGKQYYGYGLKYTGTGSGVANYLQLIADNQNGADVIAIGINQSGQVGIGANADTNYRLYVNGTSYFTGNMTFVSIGGSGTTGTSPSISWSGSTDSASIYYTVPSADAGILVINMTDDANARISLRTQDTERIGIDSNGTYVNTQLQRAGKSVSWYQGRDTAIIKTTSYSGYDAILSMKTTNGDWSQGVYSSNIMYWTYITDTNYNANTNTITSQMYLTSEGHLHLSYGNLYIHKANSGIYFTGTKATHRMIRFLDNTSDVNGNGISIGGGGLTILGSGESADTIVTNVASAGGTETTYIASDNNIQFYPGQNSYDASALISMSPSQIWAGVNGNTTREAQVGCQSGAGQIYFWSAASASGNRGVYLPAHGTGGAKAVIEANTNNSTTIRGNDTWGGKLRAVDNWLGFYASDINTTTRYGYIQCNVDRMYFRKENGVSTYGFDFNSSLYTSSTYNSGTSCGVCIRPTGTPWPYILYGTAAGGSTYVSVTADWCYLYTELPVKRASDNYYYRARFFFREYSHNGSGTRVNYFEDYYLPQCDNSRTANAGYNILTTKNLGDADSRFVTLTTAQTITGTKSWGTSGAGGQLNGAATNGGINSIRIGDDIWLGDCNQSGIMGMKSTGANCGFWMYNSSGTNIGRWTTVSDGCRFHNPNSTNQWIYVGSDTASGNKGYYIPGYGGGWYMQDTTWIRSYGSKHVYINTNLRVDGTFQIGADNVTHHWVLGAGSSYAWCDVRNASNTVLQNIVVYDTYMQFREIRANAVKNAVWNDYAEYRLAETEEPGRVVIPYDDKIARISTERLQSGGRIISDTYGNIVGQNDIAKTPVGLAGRVLAYPYRDKSEYHIGDAVCSAPNGTVDIMTRDEIMMYPERILGIVNEIPDYETWESTLTYEGGLGKNTQQVAVKGRIWIDIK